VIVVYVSGHGFGHATRTAEVLRVVRAAEPEMPLTVVGVAPEGLFRQAVPGEVRFRSLECDVGIVQADALRIDEVGTGERCRAFALGFENLIRSEERWLRHSGARVVVGDIPPLAFSAAVRAGIASIGLANFSWDWVYRHMGLPDAASVAAGAYGHTTLLLELPFAGDLGAFPRREPIPLVARRPRVPGAEGRRRLGLEGPPLILLSFGGLGLDGMDMAALEALDQYRFVMTGRWAGLPANATALAPERLEAAGLGYEDLVAAAEVVVTKPGYGIVSDAIGAGTRLVYTERGDFPEYPILVREMARYLPCAHVSNEELLAGRLGAGLQAALDQPFPAPPDLGGASVAARRILETAS